MRTGKANFKMVDLVLTALSFLILAAATVWVISHWDRIPDLIPTHYDFAGHVDAEGSKTSIWILPGFGFGIWLLFTVLAFVQGNAKADALTRTFLGVILLFISALFSYLTLVQARGEPLSPVFVPLELLLLTGSVIVYLILYQRVR